MDLDRGPHKTNLTLSRSAARTWCFWLQTQRKEGKQWVSLEVFDGAQVTVYSASPPTSRPCPFTALL